MSFIVIDETGSQVCVYRQFESRERYPSPWETTFHDVAEQALEAYQRGQTDIIIGESVIVRKPEPLEPVPLEVEVSAERLMVGAVGSLPKAS